mmetsp:Transcript_8064/g.18211  ORF Transcript_8064/g.18211 Transcript_8064/m.18211 type:complete len:420 (-) Transcript_8064:183-1442(-)|eukprot:CAMPEP_0172304436 /NCGR_PEP_ID=MMETSP1058-20130122/5845_1 /TAXON_ID=83371 /ORGANISM="Detonula confervacea, Strain CCMP 353" /LENGTH=419 /DNA_ID=CAMNT_0013015663 /DNA_START=117 /DNA_END=1376 /DNA_ORIENTATION=-
MAMSAHKMMSSSAFRSAASQSQASLLSSSRGTVRPSSRHFVSLANKSHALSKPNSIIAHRPAAATRLYSLDRPNSSPFSLFSSSGAANDGSPYGQSLEINQWPITKSNTILNIVPQGKRMVVERFGKLHAIHESGYFIAVPFVDSIAYVIDVRERAVDILPQSAITRDNVSVEVSGNLFVRVVDPERAAYGARNPLYAVMMHAQSAMRSAIGELELDEILHNRAGLNTLIKGTLAEAAIHWGLEVRRYELTEITPDDEIRIAMDKQAAAERARREQVLRAEGDKRGAELTSEGIKISLKNESEGRLIQVTNEAEAEKVRILRVAEGNAEAVKIQAAAQAEAIEKIAEQMGKPGGQEAAALALSKDYVKMYGEMGSKSNTMFFQESAGNAQSLVVQALASMKAMNNMGDNTIDVETKEKP